LRGNIITPYLSLGVIHNLENRANKDNLDYSGKGHLWKPDGWPCGELRKRIRLIVADVHMVIHNRTSGPVDWGWDRWWEISINLDRVADTVVGLAVVSGAPPAG
jgi:hypothetical protein